MASSDAGKRISDAFISSLGLGKKKKEEQEKQDEGRQIPMPEDSPEERKRKAERFKGIRGAFGG